MSNQHIEVVASNTTSDGILSFSNGQPVIQFIIGEQDRYLLGNSVRLVGNFSVLNGSGALGSANASLSMDGRTSLYSCIDQLVIKSQATNQTIEHIRNFGRFMASYLATTCDRQDGLSYKSEMNLQVPNFQGIKDGIVDNQGNLGEGPSFSLELPCGLFNGTGPIPLSRSWGIGGLLLEIHLAPDNNVLYATTGLGTDISNAFYQFKNLSLCAEVQRPNPSELATLNSRGSKGGTFEYNSVSSYYTTIDSSNGIVNFALGLSRVLSVFCNFIPSSQINNRAFNGMSTNPLTNDGGANAFVRQVIFTRGGERLPLEYNIDTLQKYDPNNIFPEAQLIRNYIDAIKTFSKNISNSLNVENMTPNDLAAPSTGDGYNEYIDGGCGFGIGVAFDKISNQGIDFSSTNFGIQIDNNLTTTNPQSVYMFVYSKQTLVFNESGVNVLK